MEEDRYNLGYTRDVEQARPIVGLEHRVKRLEHGQNVLGFIGGFIGGYIAGRTLVIIAYFIKDRMMGSGSINYGKAKTEGNVMWELNEGGNTRRANGKNVRRHARDFNIHN
jgi:hypothetical protein